MSFVDEETQKQIVAEVLEARAKRPEFLAQMRDRQKQGWEIARKCACLLKEQFGVDKVVLFGSMLDVEQMHWRSDIDLAVWGLPEDDYFRAVSRLLDVDPQFDVDLVEIQNAKPYIAHAIEASGVEL